MDKFEELLGKDCPLLKSIRERQFTEPTEIQEKSIPKVLDGKNVIGGASTGSGKTLAFGAGLNKNVKKDNGIQGLVLAPTRELAEQIRKELEDLLKFKDLKIISIYGGVPINPQIKELMYADIVVGTPGRIIDHIQRNSINLSKINTLVLDEADRMLDMGFRDDVILIVNKCPKKRQTLLFSATISEDIIYLSKKFIDKSVEVSAEQQVDPKKLKQIFYDIEDSLKFSLLKHLLENEKSHLVMIFCNTRNNVDFVANNLSRSNIEAIPIHGGFSQDKRNKVLDSFHKNQVNVLVATDVAARGLHIDNVSHVYNYDIPPNLKEYIHRIGRTARAGAEGKVINVLASRDYENFRNILKGDFDIKSEKTPYVEKQRLKWIPDRNNNRDRKDNNSRGSYSRSSGGSSYGRNSGSSNYKKSSGSSSYGRNSSSSSYGRGNDSRRTDYKKSDSRNNRNNKPSGSSYNKKPDSRKNEYDKRKSRDFSKNKKKEN
ncbi:DEAD/DEAH box helicase [Candidatus Pacearchaeota archaeon]|nr:DEAD/DEAH box helicase [Candidatus Pacearchaeota archaeon]